MTVTVTSSSHPAPWPWFQRILAVLLYLPLWVFVRDFGERSTDSARDEGNCHGCHDCDLRRRGGWEWWCGGLRPVNLVPALPLPLFMPSGPNLLPVLPVVRGASVAVLAL
jgi:hypothetical protein